MKHLMIGTLAWALIAPWAVAGPVEDTETAEKEFARGDLVAAMTLWRAAANQEYAPAMARLGDILDKSEEDEEAVAWYRKAAALDNSAGEYGLGQMYAKGEGVPADFEQARLYTMRAAQKKYLPAMVMMMEAYRVGGLGLQVDKAEADAWQAKVIAVSPSYKRAIARVAKAKKTEPKVEVK